MAIRPLSEVKLSMRHVYHSNKASFSRTREARISPREIINMPAFRKLSNDGSSMSVMCSRIVRECTPIHRVSRTLTPLMDGQGYAGLGGILTRKNASMKRNSDAPEAIATLRKIRSLAMLHR